MSLSYFCTSRRRHTRWPRDWSSDVCSSDLKKEKTLEKKQYEIVGEEYGKGKSISHLAEQFGVKQATILINLKKYFEDGHKIDPEGLLAASSLSERKKDEVFTSMETHGSSILKPVYEDLNKSVDYGELRILQLAYEAQKRE